MSDNFSVFIGLMSGTSLDGVDGVLAAFNPDGELVRSVTRVAANVPFPAGVRDELLALQSSTSDEIHREAMVANVLVHFYAECVQQLLSHSGWGADAVRAIGVHGQTIRHRPDLGYTRQINNSALLAELCGVDVVADFRSRDVAAGGQGAPLVPAFHQAMFGQAKEIRVVANIGGMSNISVLDPERGVTGFDTGPGNVLMDLWISQHQGRPYDAQGSWAAEGNVLPALLNKLLEEPFLKLPPPKSTGRDLFHSSWLASKLVDFLNVEPVDVQATLTAFTAATLADAISHHAAHAASVYVCGGGAYNQHLMFQLQQALLANGHKASVESTSVLGVSPNHVEALAFAWLAHRHIERLAGNLAEVTGAKGPRILGALYPA